MSLAAIQTRTGFRVHGTTNGVTTLCGSWAYGGAYSNGTLVVTCYWCRHQLAHMRHWMPSESQRITALMGGDER